MSCTFKDHTAPTLADFAQASFASSPSYMIYGRCNARVSQPKQLAIRLSNTLTSHALPDCVPSNKLSTLWIHSSYWPRASRSVLRRDCIAAPMPCPG